MIEAFSDKGNWGKFLVSHLADELGPLRPPGHTPGSSPSAAGRRIMSSSLILKPGKGRSFGQVEWSLLILRSTESTSARSLSPSSSGSTGRTCQILSASRHGWTSWTCLWSSRAAGAKAFGGNPRQALLRN